MLFRSNSTEKIERELMSKITEHLEVCNVKAKCTKVMEFKIGICLHKRLTLFEKQ